MWKRKPRFKSRELRGKPPLKYGNSMYGGSKLEEVIYALLKAREEKGEISDIKRQQSVELQGGSRETRISWRADFSFTRNDTGELWYCEAKGYQDEPVWKLKLKMIRYQKIKTEIWAGTYTRPFLQEVIE